MTFAGSLVWSSPSRWPDLVERDGAHLVRVERGAVVVVEGEGDVGVDHPPAVVARPDGAPGDRLDEPVDPRDPDVGAGGVVDEAELEGHAGVGPAANAEATWRTYSGAPVEQARPVPTYTRAGGPPGGRASG
jgi:hypothetical protein